MEWTLHVNDNVIQCEDGANLMTVLLRNGFELDNACGGRKICGKCKVRLVSGGEPSAAEQRHLSSDEVAQGIRLACFVKVDRNLEVRTLAEKKTTEYKALMEGFLPDFDIALPRDAGKYGIAVDIGTTTVALRLLSLVDGKVLGEAADVNPQKKYGLDVLSRITYEMDNPDRGKEELQKAIVDLLNDLIWKVCSTVGILPNEITRMAVSANCTMIHMLLGVDARSIGRAPFQPILTGAQRFLGEKIGLICGEAEVYCIPAVSSYIGGDIVAGAYVCGLKNRKGNTLFIDIGTNGEIILAQNGRMDSCSCAAGPALEGMNLSCGMRGETGAISDIFLDASCLEYSVIGGGSPKGICGSGILSGMSQLLRNGILRKSGAFVRIERVPEGDYRRKYLEVEEDGTRSFLLTNSSESGGKTIRISQQDVRQVQLAKGAIRSGFQVLLSKEDIKEEEVDLVIVAGQFGSHLAATDLTGTGILPTSLQDRIEYVGNTALSGASMALLSDSVKEEMEELSHRIEYTELGEAEGYEYILAQCMEFPKQGK